MARQSKTKIEMTPKIRAKIVELAMAGATNLEIAKHFDVSEPVVYRWLKEDPTLKKEITPAKKYADDKVVDSLYKRAQGYDVEEKEITIMPNGAQIIKTKIKHIPASEVAMIFWLKNRQPEEWQDKRVVDVTGSVNYQEKRKELDNLKAGILASETD